MADNAIDEAEREMIAHALGIPKRWKGKSTRRGRWSYRNYFAAGKADMPLWNGLVRKGLAVRRGAAFGRAKSDYPVFHVTLEGMIAAEVLPYVPRDMRPPERKRPAAGAGLAGRWMDERMQDAIEPQDFKPGDLILFTQGDYSDYLVVALMRVVEPLSREEIKAAVDHRSMTETAVLMRAGKIEEVEFFEVSNGYSLQIDKGGLP